ncbi:MAG: magnesium/cobalt transporter CorA [Bacteroidota bacterium]
MPKKNRKNTGLAPGAVVFTGRQKVDEVLIHECIYSPEKAETKPLGVEAMLSEGPSQPNTVRWIDLRSIHDTELIQAIGNRFTIHPLALEDITDIYQRPKLETYGEDLFLLIKEFHWDSETLKLTTEQVSLYFRQGLLLSFQETESDLFVKIRERIAAKSGRIRQRGAEYLAYALMDGMVDRYFQVLDRIEERIERLEDQILDDPNPEIKGQIHRLKKQVVLIRKNASPLREAIAQFTNADLIWMGEETLPFVRDLADHINQVLEMVESQREVLNSLYDLFLSELGYRNNQVIQLLTLISAVFIPLSFIVGLYGMNFQFMPELGWSYGYLYVWMLMIGVALGLLFYFRRKKWL